LVTRQGDLERLLQDLAAGRVHFVLSDAPPSEATGLRVFAHLLAESGLLLFGKGDRARRARRGFPRTLDDMPILLPSAGTPLRRQIERWFAERSLRLRIAGEFDDAGMLRVAGAGGLGLFPVRASLRSEIEGPGLAELVGPLNGIVERYYVISIERRVRDPAIGALIAAGRAQLARSTRLRRRPKLST
jgi:LysR family transcriptional activator of nhaA